MKRFVYHDVKKNALLAYCVCNAIILYAQQDCFVERKNFPVVEIEKSSLLCKLLDTISIMDDKCIGTRFDNISIFCSDVTSDYNVAYAFRIVDGVCIVDVSDSLLVGISYYEDKRILWYNIIPFELNCKLSNQTAAVTNQIDCPMSDIIPEYFAVYYYGLMSIQNRAFCYEFEPESMDYPIIIK